MRLQQGKEDIWVERNVLPVSVCLFFFFSVVFDCDNFSEGTKCLRHFELFCFANFKEIFCFRVECACCVCCFGLNVEGWRRETWRVCWSLFFWWDSCTGFFLVSSMRAFPGRLFYNVICFLSADIWKLLRIYVIIVFFWANCQFIAHSAKVASNSFINDEN